MLNDAQRTRAVAILKEHGVPPALLDGWTGEWLAIRLLDPWTTTTIAGRLAAQADRRNWKERYMLELREGEDAACQLSQGQANRLKDALDVAGIPYEDDPVR